MTTQTTPKSDLRCEHVRGAVCWLCSDARPWWRDARIAAGLPEFAPMRWKRVTQNIWIEYHGEPNEALENIS